MKFDRTIALNIIWLAGLFVAWGFVAGQAGSPVPYNWTRLARIAHALELSFLMSLVLLMLAPAVVIGGAPDWVLWLSLTALVPSLYCAIVHIRNVGGLLAEESTVWGGTQGAVLAGVPALLMVL